MPFDPKAEPCTMCGREVDECICGLAMGLRFDTIDELDTDYLSWEFYEEEEENEEDKNEANRNQNSN